jgi:hypothetical protein
MSITGHMQVSKSYLSIFKVIRIGEIQLSAQRGTKLSCFC